MEIGDKYALPTIPNNLPVIFELSREEGIVYQELSNTLKYRENWLEEGLLRTVIYHPSFIKYPNQIQIIGQYNNSIICGEWIELDSKMKIKSITNYDLLGNILKEKHKYKNDIYVKEYKNGIKIKTEIIKIK